MFFAYNAPLLQTIEKTLTADRLTVYMGAVGNDLTKAVDLYCWNVALSGAFYGPLGVLEVALRNALHDELTKAFSSPWYDDSNFLGIDTYFPDQIQKAKNDITKWGKAVTAPRVVAELSFGFWVNLLRPGFSASYVHNLWGPAFSNAFPNGTKRSKISGMLDPLLKFRNRVAHHEPIFRKDPALRYEHTLALVRLLKPELVPWIEHHSRVRDIISRGPYRPHWHF